MLEDYNDPPDGESTQAATIQVTPSPGVVMDTTLGTRIDQIGNLFGQISIWSSMQDSVESGTIHLVDFDQNVSQFGH